MVKAVVKIELKEAKTKGFKTILGNLKVDGKALIVVDTLDKNVKRSSRNIQGVSLKEGRNINARDVLLNGYIVIEKDAFEKLAERLK